MKFAKELHSVGLLHDCNTCIVLNCNRHDTPCNTYYPADINTFLNDTVMRLTLDTEKSPDKRLVRRNTSNGHGVTSKSDTLDSYYVNLINSSLSDIRHGKVAYLFHFSQIRELLRFENIKVKYNSEGDCLEVRKSTI